MHRMLKAVSIKETAFSMHVDILKVSPPNGGDECLFYLIAGGLRPPAPPKGIWEFGLIGVREGGEAPS